MKEQIRYLKQEERQNTRLLYESVFSEDSAEFVNYYYSRKVQDNEIIVMEDEKGYEVMMHLNPYQLKINGRSAKVPYIVAVATRPDCRRKGKMYRVMKHALQDIGKAHCPFTFLLPANPQYYYGQDFVFAAENKRKPLKEQGKTASWYSIPLKGASPEKMQQAADTVNRILKEQYDVYVYRDIAYYERLLEEVKSEKGEVLQIEAAGECIGILAYGGEKQAEIKEFLLFQQYKEQEKEICNQIFGTEGWTQENMQMMVRITDLGAFSGMLKGEQEIWETAVFDPIVEENNGIWRIEWNPQGGSVKRLSKENGEEKVLTISELTAKIVKKMSIFIQEWV